MNLFKSYSKRCMWFIALMLPIFVTGCADDNGGKTDPPPTVTLTAPLRAVTSVPIDSNITVTFSEAMDQASISTATFTLRAFGSGPLITGVVTLDATNNIATFNPSGNLDPDTPYLATITTGVRDLAGTAMEADYYWSFATAATVDATLPSVIFTGAYGSTGATTGATDLPVNRASTVAFSETMDSTTITATTFTVTGPGGAAVPGKVSYIGITATFTPTNILSADTVYTSTITTGVRDLAGNPLAANYVWSWKTKLLDILDSTAPKITLANPANLATNVALNKTINATFSEAMKQTTMITSNFAVKEKLSSNPVAGTVAYDVQHNIATFIPTSDLKPNTDYTVTISSGATDLAGNALVVPAAGGTANPWTFKTAAAGAAIVPPPIPLGAATTFGSYGGTAGMTSQGLQTFIDGDIGTTAVSTGVTGFHDKGGVSYTETPLNQGTINGIIYTYPPAPGNAASKAVADAALLAAQKAYDQLVSKPGGAFAGAGELGGLTLPPGTYTSAITFNITTGDLTLDGQGDPNAVFIFQMGSALNVGIAGPTGARSVILINGAKAKNIFWQVGTSATINAAGGGTMEGTIIAQQAVSFSTAGNATITTLNGRALSLISGVTMVNTHIYLPAP